jgi:hypothetical protein
VSWFEVLSHKTASSAGSSCAKDGCSKKVKSKLKLRPGPNAVSEPTVEVEWTPLLKAGTELATDASEVEAVTAATRDKAGTILVGTGDEVGAAMLVGVATGDAAGAVTLSMAGTDLAPDSSVVATVAAGDETRMETLVEVATGDEAGVVMPARADTGDEAGVQTSVSLSAGDSAIVAWMPSLTLCTVAARVLASPSVPLLAALFLAWGPMWVIVAAMLLALLQIPGSALSLNLLHDIGALGCHEHGPMNGTHFHEITDAVCIISAKF